MRSLCLSVLLFFVTAASCFATELDDVEWIDFTGWDHDLVSTVGQIFEDVEEDIDLVVFASGDFELPSVEFGNGAGFVSQNATVGAQRFHFAFSQPIQTIVRFTSTDDFENLDVFALEVGPVVHETGAVPTVLEGDGQRRITGTGNSIGPDGAAGGYFALGETERFSLVHESLTAFKFEAIEIGIVRAPAVPEPTSRILAMFAFPMIALQARRRRRQQNATESRS